METWLLTQHHTVTSLPQESYLAHVDEIGLLQVHVELNEHSENLVTELFILHQRHADLQAVGQQTTDIILQRGKQSNMSQRSP